jgi:peptide/nickel transport system substrate-binding protein
MFFGDRPSHRRRRAAWLFAFLATVLTLALAQPSSALPAASPKEKAAPTGAATRRIVIGVRGDISSFNIYTATTAFTQEIIDLLQARLAEEQDDFRDGPPSFKPGLAASWEFSADRTKLTFHLDPRARWSDGKPLAAADVAFSSQAAASPDVGWVGSDVKEAIASVTAPDPRTIVYTFSRLYPYQLMDAVEGNIIPAHIYQTTPFAEWPKKAFLVPPPSSGPFRVKRYEHGSLIELARNPDYFRAPLPHLDSVIFRIIPDENTLTNELLAGGIDVMENLPAGAVKKVEATPRLKILRVPDLSYTFISWNTSRPLFAEARVRRALTLAIDRQAIIEGLLPGIGRPSAGPILSFMWAADPGLKPLPCDPAAARALLKEAGWEDRDGDGILDRDGAPFRFELETNQGSGLRADIVQMVSAQLKKVGIEATPRIIEYGAFIAGHEKHEYDAFVSSWRESTKVDLKSVFHSSAKTNGYDYGLYSDPELDQVIDQARMETDRTAARKLWARAQAIIVRDQPLTFLFERDRLHAVPRSLTGFHSSPRSAYVGLEDWSLEGKAAAGTR